MRRFVRVAAVVSAFAFFAIACNPSVDWSAGGDERRAWCDPTDTEVNHGHGGGGHSGRHFPYTEPKGPLSWQDCALNAFFIERGAAEAALYPAKGIAEANGWRYLAPWIPGQGTHHVRDTGVPTTFDPSGPQMLMFDGEYDNAPLTGMVWVVTSGHAPPAGFEGDNYHWHAHQVLCFIDGPFIVGDNISDALCAAHGGVNQDSSGSWLVHVWLPVYDGWEATDIFNKEHPGI
jgi:hypothetical protein